jgi:hypothetical protein
MIIAIKLAGIQAKPQKRLHFISGYDGSDVIVWFGQPIA